MQPVRTRHVIHISGFEPLAPERLTRRLTSGLNRFAPLWGATATRSEPRLSEDGHEMSWDVEAHGPNWSTATRYTVLRWDNLMAPYVEQSWARRVIGGYLALWEFARTGTIRRYFRANLRYGLFVIYPFLLLVGFALLAVAAGFIVAGLGVPSPGLIGPLVGVVTFLALMRFLGSYLFLDFALADWHFAADLCRREVDGLDAVLDRFTGVVRAGVREADVDEVLVSGVSLGAVMMVEALRRALDADPELTRHPAGLSFLTIGSSILKIGFHPAAEGLRQAVGRVGSEMPLFWVEFQAKVDPINFYRTDPVAALGMPATGRPIVRDIRIREMITPEEYRRGQRNSLHFHRQFVMPNSRRYFYDYYLICFGPMSLRERVALGGEATAAFAEDGSYGKVAAGGGAAAATGQ